MPYRNVYEEQKAKTRSILTTEPEKDPKKIEEIYRSQIPWMPGTKEFEERKELLNKTNLSTKPGQYNAAEDGRCDRGIRKSIVGKSSNRGR